MNTNKNVYFILSSAFKLVKGLKRSVLIDYLKSDVYFISHEYMDLLEFMDRRQFSEIAEKIDADSKHYFEEFLDFIKKYEIGFFTDTPERFPEISNDSVDDYVVLRDVIIEIDSSYLDLHQFQKLCHDLGMLGCKNFQLRILSPFDIGFTQGLIDIICLTSAEYLEIHCAKAGFVMEHQIKKFIENNPLLHSLYVYDSVKTSLVEVINESPGHFPVSLGKIFFINYPFDNGNCCGQISSKNLSYDFYLHNQLLSRNGCLDRKIAIDRYGNIKNCPSLKTEYGNIKDISIKNIVSDLEFQKYWFINKDQISVCKVCEFRYNCTDCRAFLKDPNDIYSKPLKCGYDPSTLKWEEWSDNSLTKQIIERII